MTIRDFIKAHRKELDEVINAEIYRWNGNGGKGTIPTPAPTYNDEERRQWILNNEGLYRWARSEGVKV